MPPILGRYMSHTKGDSAPPRRRRGRQGKLVNVDDEAVTSNDAYVSAGRQLNETLDALLPNQSYNVCEELPRYTAGSSSSHSRSSKPADFITISVATTAEMSGASLSSSLSIGSVESNHGGRDDDDNVNDSRSPPCGGVRGLSPGFYVGSPPSHLPPVLCGQHVGSPPGSLSSRYLRADYGDCTAGYRRLVRSPPRPLSPPVTLNDAREDYHGDRLRSAPPTCATPSPIPRVGSGPLHLQIESHRSGSPPLPSSSCSRCPPTIAEVADCCDLAPPCGGMWSFLAHPCLLPLVAMEEDEATQAAETNIVDKPPVSLLGTMISLVDEGASESSWGYFVDAVDDGDTAHRGAM